MKTTRPPGSLLASFEAGNAGIPGCFSEIAPLVGGGWYFHFTKTSDFFAFFSHFLAVPIEFNDDRRLIRFYRSARERGMGGGVYARLLNVVLYPFNLT
ncbi:hypothetical protein FE782_17670 [Paenibacillus antri]|uniref:Uncharacterized protein n=1 Tax=Paenibacillus antri TaxID=2582848 RepID=A0A5R9G3E4_9BACL|nr:hypothetical protein [Paenibacillus antri]TLS50877.1 hypothetical protein FE782_17670 [Paenibacillus antri]